MVTILLQLENLYRVASLGKLALPMVLVSQVGWVERAIAHSVEMQYQTTQAITVQAKYDTGQPFVNAQVSVYAPNSDTVWQTGMTDQKGQFTFAPDVTKPGTWQVKARSAGHGSILNIPVKPPSPTATAAPQPQSVEPSSATTSKAGYTSLQKGVMVASVIWGLVGTALFFAGRKR